MRAVRKEKSHKLRIMSEAKRIDASVARLTSRLHQAEDERDRIGERLRPVKGRQQLDWSAEVELDNRNYQKLDAECSTLMRQLDELRKQRQRIEDENDRAFARLGVTRRYK